MKKIIVDPSDVRRWYSVDFLHIQELAEAFEAAFAGFGDFIASGCEVTGSGASVSVAAGVVMLGGNLCSFAGGNDASGKLYVKKTVTREQGPYKKGGYLDAVEVYTAVQCASTDPGAFLLSGAKRITGVLESSAGGKYVPLEGDSTVNGVLTVDNLIIK